MTIGLNKEMIISFLITDEKGARVSDDSPTVLIKNTDTNKYWNGIDWQDDEFQISLNLVSNGVYQYSFTPNTAGTLEITKTSVKYNLRSVELFTVSDLQNVTIYNWKLGETHRISMAISGLGAAPKTEIKRDLDGFFYDALTKEWTEEKTQNDMMDDDLENYYLDFIPNLESQYLISIIYDDVYSYILVASSDAESLSPVFINGKTFKDNTGNTCEVVNGVGFPMLGTKVSCYDLNDGKKLVSSTRTDSSGNWQMSLVAGNYYFKFDHNGYISKGFEKQVI